MQRHEFNAEMANNLSSIVCKQYSFTCRKDGRYCVMRETAKRAGYLGCPSYIRAHPEFVARVIAEHSQKSMSEVM